MTTGVGASLPLRTPAAPVGVALISRTRPLVPGEVGDLLSALGPNGFAWLRDGAGFVTAGVAARLEVGPGPARFARAAADVAARLGSVETDDHIQLPGTGPIAVGALPFDHRTSGQLVVPALVVGRDAAGAGWVTHTGPPGEILAAAGDRGAVVGPAGPAVGSMRAGGFEVWERPGRWAWTAAVRRALAAIEAGELRKVVLAREVVLEATEPFDRSRILDRLRRSHPSCFTYAAGGFVGASPELLVRRRGGEVFSCPMAGTAPRGDTAEEDERLAAELRTSTKEAEEHRLLVEAVLAALAPACAEPPSAADSEIVRLATVAHLATQVSGRLRTPAPSALALVGLLHPTPAVGGLPRDPALRAITDLEGFNRGLYAGPVGWVDAAGEGEWAVALRGAELDGPRARLVAGAGIVAGSDPDAEWAETEAKLRPMLAAVGAA